MPAFTRTGNIKKTLAVSGAGLMAFTASVATAPTAAADDMERASSEVVAMIEAKEWPHYTRGDVDIDIRGAYRALGQNGYKSDEETSELGQPLRDKILAYQRDHNQFLPINGDLDDETWLLLREQTYGDEYVPGDGPDNGREWGVLGIQELLMTKHDADIDNTGYYDEDTFYAVCDAQEHYGLDADGFVGRLTWRAIITDQDWDDNGNGSEEALAQLDEPTDPPEDAVFDDEETVAQLSCSDSS